MRPNNIAKLSIMLVPCHKLPKGGYVMTDECIADVDEQRKYLQ